MTRIVTLSDDKTIFQVPTIQISNGIDAKAISIRQKVAADENIHLIGVATLSFWHGYDRVIEGLHKYYKNGNPNRKELFFHIVGDSLSAESFVISIWWNNIS